MRTDARIQELAARCHRAAGELAGIHPESPEVRASYGDSRDRRVGQSWEEDWGTSTRTGVQRTSGSGSQTTERREISETEFGDPFDPDQIAIEDSVTRESSESSEYETTRSRASSYEAATALDRERRREDEISLELQIRPPNPWKLGAERDAASAVRTLAEAELLAREQELVCDAVEAGLKLLRHRRMLRVQTAFAVCASRLRGRLFEAFESGSVSAEDYGEACRLAADAAAAQHRLEARVSELERELRFLTGVDPGQIALNGLHAAGLAPFSIPADTDEDGALIAALVPAHPVVLASQWNLHRMEAEWREARAARVPWASHLAVGYAWWEGSRTGYGTFGSTRTERETTTSTSLQSQSERSTTSGTETETPSGDMTDREETARQSSESRSTSKETEVETSTNTGTESSRESNDGYEWWVELGVEIPIFEWLSGETRARRKAVAVARGARERIERRVALDIDAALQTLRREREALETSRQAFSQDIKGLRKLAALARRRALAGELESLRIEKNVVEMAILLLDGSLREALARLDLVRAAGCAPSLEPVAKR